MEEKPKSSSLPYFVITGMTILIVFLLVQNNILVGQNIDLHDALKRYETTYETMSGAKDGYGNYYLLSIDGGNNWYAVDYFTNPDVPVILGPAEEIFPGLLQHLKSWDAFVEYVLENGPIDLANPSSEELQLFSNTGFEVEK